LIYVNQAEFLLNGLEKRHLHYPVLYAAIEACFQVPALQAYLEKRTPFTVSLRDTPDHRLMSLSKQITSTTLKRWVDDFVHQHDDTDAAKEFVFTERFPEDLDDEELLRYNKVQQALLLSMYQSIRQDSCLRVLGGENDHFDFLNALMSYVKSEFPQIAETLPHTNTMDTQALVTPVSHYESESVVYKEKHPAARLVRITAYPQEDFGKLVGKIEGMEYVYIVARVTERFIDQYQLSTQQRDWLIAAHPNFVIAVAIAPSEGELVFVVLEEPAQLRLLSHFHMLTSVSMLLTSDKRWADWQGAVSEHSTQVTLFDLPPSEQIPRSFEVYEQVLYHSFHLELADSEYAFVVLIASLDNSSKHIFFMPVSAVMSNLLLDMLGGLAPRFRLLDPEKDLSQDIHRLIQITTTRLMDESYFDFNALKTNYAERGFADAQFYGT